MNEYQKISVNHDTGPLLIIAGAGTGKTRVISERIVRLISEKKATPGEILALTFTEKAATEMMERVEDGLPLGYEELFIKTFHGFSDRLLREAGLEIGIDPGYTILTQMDQWFFFKQHIFDFELDYYRPLGNPNRFIYDLLSHFCKLKDELISPEAYLKYAEGVEDGEERTKAMEVARAYAKYQELMIESNYLDFGDLTYKALELLNKRESVLREYQQRFKYLLVDEFQDTNYAQFQLVLMLSQAHKNLVVVGDDDQSIYKWRGASLSNILQFEEKFPEAKKVVLVQNYRSTQEILDGAYSLIQNNNPDRLEVKSGLSKKLEASLGSGEKAQVHHFPNFALEAEFVGQKIKELHAEGIGYEEIAILVRSNAVAHPFVDEFNALGIPYQVRSPKGLMGLAEIKDLIAVVRVLADPYDDVAVLRLLKLDNLGVSMAEILELMKKAGNRHLFEAMLMSDDAADNFSLPGIESGIDRVSAILMELIEYSKKQPVGLVINEFLNKSGYLHFLIENEMYEEVENINEFAKQVTKFEREHDGTTAVDFVAYLDLLEESNTVMAADRFRDRESVQILTVHGSKGLEFDHVFVVSAVKGRFPSVSRRDTFELPDELTNEIYPEGDFHIQEERRLFYVAMTRAKKGLYLCYSDLYEGGRAWKISPFVQEVLDSGMAEVVEHEDSEDAIEKLRKIREIEKPKFELQPLSSKRLSYSKLDSFKTCPLMYNYRYILNVPVAMGHAASFGSSVHDALNDFYQKIKKGEAPTLELLSEMYDRNWQSYGYDSVEHEELRREKGWEILKVFFESNSNPWVKPAFLERNFHLKLGDYSFTGRIDRIDKLEDGSYEVIDYKTGRLKSEPDLRKDLQLSLYALACRDVLKLNVSKLSLYFLEDNEKVSTTRSAEDLAGVASGIGEMIGEMQESQFLPTPGFHCGWCDFKLICPAA